jgi:hypothetical protein
MPIRRGTNKESTSVVVKIGRDRGCYHGGVGAGNEAGVGATWGRWPRRVAGAGGGRSPASRTGCSRTSSRQLPGRASGEREFDGLASAGFYCAGHGTCEAFWTVHLVDRNKSMPSM